MLYFHPNFERDLKQRNARIESEHLDLIRSLYPDGEARDDQDRIAFLEAGILEQVTAITESHLNGFPTRDALDMLAQWALARASLIQKQLEDRGRIMQTHLVKRYSVDPNAPENKTINCRCVMAKDAEAVR